MGISVSYRGRLPDLARVEDFEDRLLDFALGVGGLAQVWRSHADDCPQRVVRGVILHLAPGQEPTSLLLSPEGWLIGLADIEDAERGRLTEPPWCFTKTQFGPLEGHVALVEMLAALRREFVPDLEVSDEGGYWETRNLAELVRKRSLLREAIDGLMEGLQRHGLSREAAEDPDLLLRRIERIAAQVHRILRRPAEHPPAFFRRKATESKSPLPILGATMNRRERRKQKKNKERQERLRREKYVRPSPPHREDAGGFAKAEPNDAENLSGAAPATGSLTGGTSASHPPGDADAGRPAEAPLDNFFKGEPARQWLDALLAGTDAFSIVKALEPAEYVPGHLLLKASACCEILVAAELVAAGRGRPSRHLPASVAAWLREQDVLFSPGVVAMAAAAVRRVGEFSELRQLWDAVRLGPEWLHGVEALVGRLQR